jgi:tetratricopeptide (TPR) repeat protein
VLFYNLGLIYERNGLLDEALAAFARSQAINPRHVASSGRVRAADRFAELQVERERIAALERALATDATLQGWTPGTPDYHVRMAGLLEARGEPLAARGHRLRAQQGT